MAALSVNVNGWMPYGASLLRLRHDLVISWLTCLRHPANGLTRTHTCTSAQMRAQVRKPQSSEDTVLLKTKLERRKCTIFSPHCVDSNHHATLDPIMKLTNNAHSPSVALPMLCRPATSSSSGLTEAVWNVFTLVWAHDWRLHRLPWQQLQLLGLLFRFSHSQKPFPFRKNVITLANWFDWLSFFFFSQANCQDVIQI